MNKEVTVEPRQSLIDLAIQETGSVEAAIEMVDMNDISITGELDPGAKVMVPGVKKRATQQYYANRKLKPATGDIGENTTLEGIGYWGIEYDFIVS